MAQQPQPTSQSAASPSPPAGPAASLVSAPAFARLTAPVAAQPTAPTASLVCDQSPASPPLQAASAAGRASDGLGQAVTPAVVSAAAAWSRRRKPAWTGAAVWAIAALWCVFSGSAAGVQAVFDMGHAAAVFLAWRGLL
ncbi:MAG: hypothetical protein LBI84_02435 [Propionibacteriaceae bacterium]|jgi:hypothetical protein|nr:hypothetical protein [Propionibacteriaceae bacterium]